MRFTDNFLGELSDQILGNFTGLQPTFEGDPRDKNVGKFTVLDLEQVYREACRGISESKNWWTTQFQIGVRFTANLLRERKWTK